MTTEIRALHSSIFILCHSPEYATGVYLVTDIHAQQLDVSRPLFNLKLQPLQIVNAAQ